MSRFRLWGKLVLEKSLSFRKFGLRKKVSVSVSKKIGLGKKCRFWFRKIWYLKKSLGIGFGQNFGIAIQWIYGVGTMILCYIWSRYLRRRWFVCIGSFIFFVYALLCVKMLSSRNLPLLLFNWIVGFLIIDTFNALWPSCLWQCFLVTGHFFHLQLGRDRGWTRF